MFHVIGFVCVLVNPLVNPVCEVDQMGVYQDQLTCNIVSEYYRQEDNFHSEIQCIKEVE